MTRVEMESLVGKHLLSGVDQGVSPRDEYDDYDPACIRFVLDGQVYEAQEDPCDSYRSCMRDLALVGGEVKNIFPPAEVIVTHRTEDKYGTEDDVLEFRSATDGALILEIGTVNVADYYPGFVGAFFPERMPKP